MQLVWRAIGPVGFLTVTNTYPALERNLRRGTVLRNIVFFPFLLQGLMLDLIRYNISPASLVMEQEGGVLGKRFLILTEACEGNASLLVEVEKLRSSSLRQTVLP